MLPANNTPIDRGLYNMIQAAWRTLCEPTPELTPDDPDFCFFKDCKHEVQAFLRDYPEVVPECFRSINRDVERLWCHLKALDIVYGKKRRGIRSGGAVGRLRVLAGEPLQHRVIAFGDIEALRDLEFDAFTLFCEGLLQYVESVLAEYLPEHCWFVIERGSEFGKLHIHLLCKPGTTDLGSNLGIIPDNELLSRVGYLSKRPVLTPEDATAYVTVRRGTPGDGVATRYRSSKGIGARRSKVSLQDIERVLGVCPASDNEHYQEEMVIEATEVKTGTNRSKHQSGTNPISPVFAEAA